MLYTCMLSRLCTLVFVTTSTCCAVLMHTYSALVVIAGTDYTTGNEHRTRHRSQPAYTVHSNQHVTSPASRQARPKPPQTAPNRPSARLSESVPSSPYSTPTCRPQQTRSHIPSHARHAPRTSTLELQPPFACPTPSGLPFIIHSVVRSRGRASFTVAPTYPTLSYSVEFIQTSLGPT